MCPRRFGGAGAGPADGRLIDVGTSRKTTPPRRLLAEEGSMIVAALVAAVLVAVMAVAFFGALNGSTRVSGVSKARAQAASLAQDDQERLRSMPVVTLSTLNSTAVKQVAGINYNVTSRADGSADATQANPDCTANGAAADSLRIPSTVAPANNLPGFT